MKKKHIRLIIIASVIVAIACLVLIISKDEVLKREGKEANMDGEELESIDSETEIETTRAEEPDETDVEKEETLTFVDVFGEEYQTVIVPEVEKVKYDKDVFVHDGSKLFYEDDEYYSRIGVDVSHHQGIIDWQRVKNQGYDFAFIRLGYRGYGQSGTVNLDRTFDRNIEMAHQAGLDVGVYFFSQAINEEEAEEEANFVINHLSGYSLELPVVYDPESILDDDARTDNVSGEQFTRNTAVFCKKIEDAGYQAMIYSNMLWEAFEFDLTQLRSYPIWYADYEPKPQTPYSFDFWQYSNEGIVDGIQGRTDVDIQLIEKEEEDGYFTSN